MNYEILSIETLNKISNLEKENKEFEKIICNFDKELNRLFNIVKTADDYINNVLLKQKGSISDLKTILEKAIQKDEKSY